MWKKVLIVFILINLSVGAYLHFNRWFKYDRYTLWSLVPENALIVFENSNLMDTWADLQSFSTWQNVSNIGSVALAGQHLNFLDSLMGNEYLSEITSNNPVLISLHVTSKTQFDFLFQLELQNVESHSSVWQALDALEDMGFQSSSRSYLGHQLTEIRKGNDVFTYIFYLNYFIGSFTPFLVEDAIRTVDGDNISAFKDQHTALFSLVKLQNDAGNIYINAKKLNNLAQIFSDQLKYDADFLSNAAKSTFLDIAFNEENVLLSGFTLTEANNESFLSTFNNNPARPFGLSGLVPENTALFYHFTASDFTKWGKALDKNWQENQTQIISDRAEIKAQFDIDIGQFYSWMADEIGQAIIESSNLDHPNKMVFVKTNDPSEALKQLNRLANVSTKEGDSLYTERHHDITISQVEISQLPKLLFGPLFDQFDQTYYAFFGQYLIMSNNIQTLKNWYNDYQNDDIWGKSIRTTNFLEATLQEANFSLFINTNRAWNKIGYYLSEDWRRFFEENGGVFRRFEMAAIQFSYIDNKFYTSLALHQPEQISEVLGNYTQVQNLEFAAPIITKPFIVKSHLDKSFETVVQDSLNNLYLINSSGEVLWNDSINGRIQSDVFQIDFYKNGKYQYFFATENHLHIIDRNGDAVSPSPIQLPEGVEVHYLSLVDYDNSKKYRYMVADRKGSIYLFDKNGNNLEGWTPLELTGSFNHAPFHIRIRTRDRIVAVQKNGIVNVINRPGKLTDGFPFDLKAQLGDQCHLQVGADFSTTTMTTITADGEMIEFNLSGNVVRKEQFYKPSPETVFATLPDALGQSFLFVRKSGHRIAVLNPDGTLLFEKDYLSSEDLQWQYYNFGGNKEIIVVLDKQQEFAYLYNRKGQLINYQPVESGHSIGLLYFAGKNKFRLYKTYRNEFSALEFSYD